MIPLLYVLHGWGIHVEQGQFHDWRDSSSGRLAAREGRGFQSMARQNHVGGRVAVVLSLPTF